jgi:molybdenum cofactor guanylyltransferase
MAPVSSAKTSKAQAPIAGSVLAGGASSRFGSDKSRAELGGTPMLTRMTELLRCACDDVRIVVGAHSLQGEGVIADRWPGEGPLGGIITALLATKELSEACEWNLIVGCDMPFLNADWLLYLVERARASTSDVITPRSANGLEPLCAVWRVSAARKLQSAFDTGVRKVTEAMKLLRMEVVDEREWKRFDAGGRLFWNMNTVADFEDAKRVMMKSGLQ